MTQSLFRDALTFYDLPRSTDFVDADAVLFGIPFDCARDLTRFGSRQGPNAIRQASILTANLMQDADPNPLEQLRVVDAGNVDLPMDDIETAFVRIEAAVQQIIEQECIPLGVGGDGAVSLPQMRALHQRHGPFALLHFDAHTDAWPVPESGRYNNASQFTHAGAEDLLDMAAAVHVGTRGPVNARVIQRQTESMGYRVIPFDECRSMGMPALLQELRSTVGERPLFICFDMDFFDPAMVPGVVTPTPGGALPEEGLALMRGLAGLNVIGIDVNTTTPLHDAGGVTATLAASVIAEGLGLLCPPT